MTTKTADPIRNPVRSLGISSPNADIAIARAKLDHAANAKQRNLNRVDILR